AGPGIPPEFRTRLFERFSKADTSRSGGGSGLGLAIASENAALIGARIEADSDPDAGTRFTLHLPHTPGGA
ncbi:MAG: ATP-binding protein, partial [Mycobacteriales bacterium]